MADNHDNQITNRTRKDLVAFLGSRGIGCNKRKRELEQLAALADVTNCPVREENYDRKAVLLARRTVSAKPDGQIFIAEDPKCLQFTSNLQKLPPISWPKVFVFLCDTCGWSTSKVDNIRQSPAYSLYKGSHINNVKLATVPSSKDSAIYIKANCTRQTTWSAKDYECWLLLNKDGSVLSASCECTGDDGQCKHILAFLYSLVEFESNHQDRSDETCTDRPCVWNRPRVSSTPMLVEDINLRSSYHGGEGSPSMTTTYNPLPNPALSQKEVEKAFRKLLKSEQPRAVTLTVIDSSGSSSSSSQSVSQAVADDLPSLLDMGRNAQHDRCDDEFIDYMKDQHTDDLVLEIEERTQEQSDSEDWKRLRKGRITASVAHKILHAKASTISNCDNYLTKLVMGSDTPVKTPAMEYGNKNEPVARALYVEAIKENHSGLQVRTCGLHVLQDHPYIGASPDGLVDCECHPPGLIEIKCPHSLKDTDIQTVTRELLYHLVEGDANRELKHTSPFYTQVQVQMAVTGRQWCDFVIFTEGAAPYISITRVEFDLSFWQKALPKLSTFFKTCIEPKLLSVASCSEC